MILRCLLTALALVVMLGCQQHTPSASNSTATERKLKKTIAELVAINKQQQQRIAALTEALREASQRKNELNEMAKKARSLAFELEQKLAMVENDLEHTAAELTRQERARFEEERRGGGVEKNGGD